MAKEVGYEKVDTVADQGACLNKVLVAGKAGDADAAPYTLIQGHMPPRTGAAHAHAHGGDALTVHFGARKQVVEGKVLISKHHAPQGASVPKVQFCPRGLFLPSSFLRAIWAGAGTFPKAIGIYGQNHVAARYKLLGDQDSSAALPPKLLFPHIVLASVPMKILDGGYRSVLPLWQEEVSGHDGARASKWVAVMEAEVFKGNAFALPTFEQLDFRCSLRREIA